MGQGDYGLKSIADEQLLAGLASIVARRNQITAEFLAYLAELDERQLFLDLGYSSLFEYCVEQLKLCESTAGRHIAAARVCRNHPEVFALVASGALHASALSLLKKYLTIENAAELFELCSNRSARQVELLLAARFPRPDVRDSIRRMPTPAASTLNVGSSAHAQPALNVGSSTNLATMESPSPESPADQQRAPTELSSEAPVAPRAEGSKPRRFEPLSADRYGVHFAADGEFCALLDRVRGLAGHRLPSGDLMTLLKHGLEAYERELEKERFAVHGKTRHNRDEAQRSAANCIRDVTKPDPRATDEPKLAPSTTGGTKHARPTSDHPNSAGQPPRPRSLKRRRRYPATVTRAVFLRDGKQCSYLSPEGRRCSARRCLELDHIEPLAAGGADTIENLRLRCRAHNQLYARQYFGKARVDAALQANRRRRSVRASVTPNPG
ncbi:MAG TPA: HNH endonuclease signature motif containing protein [Polyangiaceae bacterium]|nr:HNH endonuclease signature motif containing protein [Polyangiaceae bacterium]